MNRIKNSIFLIIVTSFIFLLFGVLLVLFLNNPVTPKIPKDWKKYSDTDVDFGVKTTVSLPPGCDFKFTGSEWDLGCGEGDRWDYTTSVFRGKDDKLKNYYGGGALKQWYQRYLNYEFFGLGDEVNIVARDEILKTKEHKVEQADYLELTVKEGDYKEVAHYLFIQNGIVHIVRPLIIDEPTSKIKKNIGLIFSSLKSEIFSKE